ncbi:MAG: hypothetical protein ACRES6_04850 [Steroidobacteraceae bacterium]
MRFLGGIAATGCALALGGMWAITGTAANATARDAPHGSAAAVRPALWRTYDMLVNLQNLPRTYTCDQLWYEFRGILLRLGAWPYTINVLPYQCSSSPSGYMRSPNVEVRFQLPVFLQASAAKWAPAKAVERTLRLSPGEPKTLHSSDCQLLQQISRTMLASLPVRVDEEHFDCSAPPPRSASFNVTLSLPMGVNRPAVAATSGPGPH